MTETLREAPPSDAEARKHRGTLRNARVVDSMGTMRVGDNAERSDAEERRLMIDLDGGSTR
jgi:hypothetical protein